MLQTYFVNPDLLSKHAVLSSHNLIQQAVEHLDVDSFLPDHRSLGLCPQSTFAQVLNHG